MDISALNNVVPSYLTDVANSASQVNRQDEEFSGILQSLMNVVNEANDAHNRRRCNLNLAMQPIRMN